MAAVFKIDGFDLSAHLRVNQGDGLDPYDTNGYLEPQFADGALTDGDPLISIREGNREQAWAVILNPARAGYTASKDGLHQLIRDVNRVLKNAQVIEWCDDGASASTYFDARFARFDPAWDYRRSQQLWVPGVIKAWTHPYGHTGTARVVATTVSSQPLTQSIQVASGALGGDADGVTFTTLTMPSGGIGPGRAFVGVAAGPNHWVPIYGGAVLSLPATLIGASGAYASQAARQIAGATYGALFAGVNSDWAPDGQWRVIALARTTAATALASAIAMTAYVGGVTGATAPLGATQILPTGQDWRVVDLGTFAGGSQLLPAWSLQIRGGLLSASAGATSSYDLSAVLVLPEGNTAALMTASNSLGAIPTFVATFTFDGLQEEIIGQSGTPTQAAFMLRMEDVKRGAMPRLPVGSAQSVFAFAIPDNAAQNKAIGVEVRVRERFTYSR